MGSLLVGRGGVWGSVTEGPLPGEKLPRLTPEGKVGRWQSHLERRDKPITALQGDLPDEQPVPRGWAHSGSARLPILLPRNIQGKAK